MCIFSTAECHANVLASYTINEENHYLMNLMNHELFLCNFNNFNNLTTLFKFLINW